MGMKCLFGHQWNGCKCEKCGKTRNEQHSWQNAKCNVCGATQKEIFGEVLEQKSNASGNPNLLIADAAQNKLCEFLKHYSESDDYTLSTEKRIEVEKDQLGHRLLHILLNDKIVGELSSKNPKLLIKTKQRFNWIHLIATNNTGNQIESKCLLFIVDSEDGVGKIDIINGGIDFNARYGILNFGKAFMADNSIILKYKKEENETKNVEFTKRMVAQEPVKQNTIASQTPTSSGNFVLIIDDVISKQGRGTYVKGFVKNAGVIIGDTAYIVNTNGSVKATKINDIRDDVESPAGLRNSANIGDSVVLLLQGIAISDVAKGDILSATEKLPFEPVINDVKQPNVENTIRDEQHKMSPIEKFKSMSCEEKEAYLKEIDRLDLIDLFQKGRDEKFDSNDIPILCHALKWRMMSAHEMRQGEFVEKAMLVLSCENENHVKNYRSGMSTGFIHPDVAARAFDQLINDYRVLIDKFN